MEKGRDREKHPNLWSLVTAASQATATIIVTSYPSAAANGHPTNAPSAVKNTAPGILPIYQHPTAIMVVFMANELGRNAVDDENIPAAKTRAASVRRPVFTPN